MLLTGQLVAGDSDELGEHIQKQMGENHAPASAEYTQPTQEEEARVKRELTESKTCIAH